MRRLVVAFVALAFGFLSAGCERAASSGGATTRPAPGGSPIARQTPDTSPKPQKTPAQRPSASTGAGDAVAARIVFVDVGQGDAIIIRSGTWTVLVDGGPPGSDHAIAAQLKKSGADDIDTLIVTHPDRDHIGGLAALVPAYDPETALVAADSPHGPWSAVEGALASVGTRIVPARRGDRYGFGKVKAQVLSPAGAPGDDTNEASIVLLLTVAGERVLLTGDITGPRELAVGDLLARGPPIDVLKVAHHGSSHSTSTFFLDDVRPRVAVISVGPNSYGHPTPETLERLADVGARIYTTQQNGTITLTIFSSGEATWSFSGSSRPVLGIGPVGGVTQGYAGAGSNATTVVGAGNRKRSTVKRRSSATAA